MSILDEAAELINGQRATDYGDVTENFARIADMWSAYKGEFFYPHDVSMMMILVKVARQSSGYHRDSALDIAGYAALDEKVHAPVSEDFWEDIDAKIAEAQEKRERDRTQKPPRVWESLNEVPLNVGVTDKDGELWRYFLPGTGLGVWQVAVYGGWSGGCELDSEDLDDQDTYGPFTEVLDTERAEARSSSGPASPDRAEQKGSK